jgi:hypothetical protein
MQPSLPYAATYVSIIENPGNISDSAGLLFIYTYNVKGCKQAVSLFLKSQVHHIWNKDQKLQKHQDVFSSVLRTKIK